MESYTYMHVRTTTFYIYILYSILRWLIDIMKVDNADLKKKKHGAQDSSQKKIKEGWWF